MMDTEHDEAAGANVWPARPKLSGFGAAGDTDDAPAAMALQVETLPYVLDGARLSPFRSGEAILARRRLRLTGRMGASRERRSRVYLLGGLGFVPGIIAAYLTLERAPWARESLDIDADEVVAVSCRADYRLVTVLYRSHAPGGAAGLSHSITFQVDRARYSEVVDGLEQHFPGKLRAARIRPAVEPGAEFAWIGVALWALVIAAGLLAQP